MKTKLLLTGALAVIVSSLFVFADASPKRGLVVHEWGTFTSFQGGDGVPLSWRPLVTSVLPRFVYDWTKPGLNRVRGIRAQIGGAPFYATTKQAFITLQRMETPVIYFYSDKPVTADISVSFPQGTITEWYPQAGQVGPSFVPPSQRLAGFDKFIHKCGAPARFSLVSMLSDKPVTNSLIHWSGIHVLPPDADAKLSSLPTDTSGSHYFAARETDANLIRLDSLSQSNPAPQYEKFLFYRGVASFATPLTVTMKSDDTVTLANTGEEPLAHLFVLDVKAKSGAFIYVPKLLPGQITNVTRAASTASLSPADLTARISREMSAALVKEGLYPREADAMVKTWKSSWFAEDGTRVLYVLPRAWTDRTLPMTLAPAPRELARVMVGRAEILTPGAENNLVNRLKDFRDHGDAASQARLTEAAKSLGRFGEPAFYKAMPKLSNTRPDEYTKLANLFFAAAKNSNPGPDFE